MLRLKSLQPIAIRGFHTTGFVQAKAVVKKKAPIKGYKKNDTTKAKKTSGVGKLYYDYTNTQRLQRNAAEIPDLGVLEGELTEGSVVRYNALQMKKLIVAGSFKPNQFNEAFQTPISLITEDTKHMEKFVSKASKTSSKENRICFLGENGIGKSTLLAQTQGLISNLGDSVILPISYAYELVNGRTDFAIDQQLEQYTQPMYLKSWLSKIRSINKEVLSKIPVTKDHSFEGNTRHKSIVKAVPARHTVYDLVKMQVTPRSRGKQLNAIIQELSTQDKFPVFLTVDNFSAFTSNHYTPYRDTFNKPLHVSKFQIASLVFDFASGEKSFKKGGVVLSTSTDDKPSLNLYAGLGLASPDPYVSVGKYDRKLAAKLNTVEPYELHKFSKQDVGNLVQKFIDADIFKQSDLEGKSFETLVNQKYFLSGNGNPGELIKSVIMLN